MSSVTSSVTPTTPVESVRGFYAVYEWSVWDKSTYGPSLVLSLGAFFAVAVVVRATLPQRASAGKEGA